MIDSYLNLLGGIEVAGAILLSYHSLSRYLPRLDMFKAINKGLHQAARVGFDQVLQQPLKIRG